MLLLLLTACTDDKITDDTAAPDDTGTVPEGPPVEVRVVDTTGTPMNVEGVAWFDPATTPVPVRAALQGLRCNEGSPPCATWTLDAGELPPRVQIVTERFGAETGPDEDGATCFEWDAPWTVVHLPEGADAQVVHLVINPDQRWCDDGISASARPPLLPPKVHPDDVRVEPAAVAPALTVRGVDPGEIPLPLAIANWYYPPESPEYDGEHPLTCADALCATWVLPEGDGPASGQFYVSATWMGPLHPFGDPTWTDYQGSPTEPGVDVTLQFDTTVALVE